MRRLLTIGHSYVVAANRRLADELARQGAGRWEVTAIAPRRCRGDLRPVELEPLKEEADRLQPIDLRFDYSPHFMWYRDLRHAIAGRWHVIHGWQEPYVLAGAQIARTAPRDAKLVISTFQNIAKRYPWPLTAFERTTMTRADGWIAFGHTIHQTLATRTLYAAKPSRVLSPGVDAERFRPDASRRRSMLTRIGWLPSDPVVGFLGRFVPEKGIDVLLEALPQVAAPWRALFVGGGVMEPALQQFARRYPQRVHIQTGVPHDDVPAWVSAMTVLCAPSQTTVVWREQFGRMLIEAMACGVPVIASDSGEIPHVVGDAGAVLPERDTGAWAREIDRLLADDDLRAQRSGLGLERARAQFAWPVVARAHLDFFEAVLDGAPA